MTSDQLMSFVVTIILTMEDQLEGSNIIYYFPGAGIEGAGLLAYHTPHFFL